MKERIYIYDRSGNLVNDSERSVEYATGLRWETMWPKGYGPASFVVARDIARDWAVKQAYELIVRDGLRIVYQGRLNKLGKELRGASEQINVSAAGWYVILAERQVRKRWVGKSPMSHIEDAVINNDIQSSFGLDKREGFLQVRVSDKEDLSRVGTERHRSLYIAPVGTTIRRATFDWKRRSSEGIIIQIYNVDTSTSEWSTSGTDATGSADVTLATAANRFEFRIGPTISDLYDQNDYAYVDNLVLYSSMAFASGTPAYSYYADEIIKDLLTAKASEISSDYSEIGSPALALTPFVTQNDDYETMDGVIQRAAAYGDASYNTWGFCIWDEEGASDGKPRASFEARSVADYEYALHLAELAEFSGGESDDELANYVVVKYKDDKAITRYRTPTDNAALTDATSIASYGQREAIVDANEADTTRADEVGARYLTYHKDPLRQAALGVVGRIRTKAGIWIPANQVRAGERVKVVDYNGGQIYFLRNTDYDAESGVLRMSPDLPPDTLEVVVAQEKMGAGG